MPSTTRRQARLMAAAAHDPKFAKKVGVPQSVAKDFNKADAGTGILKGPLRRKRQRFQDQKSSSSPMVTYSQPGG
jgi:hypothetical protein